MPNPQAPVIPGFSGTLALVVRNQLEAPLGNAQAFAGPVGGSGGLPFGGIAGFIGGDFGASDGQGSAVQGGFDSEGGLAAGMLMARAEVMLEEASDDPCCVAGNSGLSPGTDTTTNCMLVCQLNAHAQCPPKCGRDAGHPCGFGCDECGCQSPGLPPPPGSNPLSGNPFGFGYAT